MSNKGKKNVDDRIFIQLLREKSSKEKPLKISDINVLMNGNNKKGIQPDPLAEGYTLDRHTISSRMKKLVQFNIHDVEDAIEHDEFDAEDLKFELSDGYIYYKLNFEHNPCEYWYVSKKNIENREMRYLIDSVLYSKILTQQQAQDLIDRILSMPQADMILKDMVKSRDYIKRETYLRNIDVLANVEVIQQAINENKKISFCLVTYRYKGTDKIEIEQECLEDSLANNIVRIVSPHEIIMKEGKYYLLASRQKDNKTVDRIYRVDLMDGIEIDKFHNVIEKPDKYKPNEISKYIYENPYMYGGDIKDVTFLIKANQFTQFVDWFGNHYEEISFAEDKEELKIRIKVNQQAFLFWAMQYYEIVTVLEPYELRKEIVDELEKKIKRYKEIEEIKKDHS